MLVFPSDPSLTPSNMITALDTLPAGRWRGVGAMVYVPKSKLDQIKSQFSSDEERKEETIRILMTQHPHPTWELVSDALYMYGGVFNDEVFHDTLNRLQSMFPTGECLC